MKKTIKQLMLSSVSLLLCLAMLLGTTYAWFTDSAVSTGNIIQTGNLDVEMYWANGTDAVPADQNGWADASAGPIFTHKKWEPGYTEVRHIKIDNAGSLAFKYKVIITANGTVTDLTDVIDVYYFDPAVQVSDRAQLTDAKKIGTLTQVLAGLADTGEGILKKGESDTITIALKMQESAGNTFMNKSVGSTFSIQIVATQTSSEVDSFGDGYDANVDYPNVSVPVVLPENATESIILSTDDVKVTVPAEIVNALPTGVTSVTLAHTDPVVDTTANTVTYSSVELVDQSGKVVDLSGNTNANITVKLPAAGFADGAEVAIYHDGQLVTKTVVADGYITYTVSHFCEVKVVPVIHVPGDVVVENNVAPDCTNDGSYDNVTYCTECGVEISRETVVVPATGHTEVAVSGKAPTCTEVGFTEGTQCSVCGDVLSAQEEIPAFGHTEATIPAVAPTCTATGLTEGKMCVTCNVVTVEQQVVPANGHKYNTVVTAPTCTTGGYTTYTCVCGDTYVADEVDATGHNYAEEVTKAPTCTEDGVKTFTCPCGDTYTEVIKTNGHALTEVEAKAPTCTEAGYETYEYCSVCDHTTFVEIPAKGHSYNKTVVTSATCTEAGYITITCRNCEKSFVSGVDAEADQYLIDYPFFNLAPKGHKYNSEVTAPTCTAAGYTTYTCSACNDTYVSDEVAATGHSYNAEVTAPTCTAAGYTTYTCACGDTYVADEVAATGHKYDAVVTAPTCEEKGYTTYTCACGDTYVADEVEATGHSYNAEVTKAPTCEEKGVKTYSCACGATYTEEIEETGHTLTQVDAKAPTCEEAGHKAYEYCSACEYTTFEAVEATGHKYDAVVTAPTCTAAGYTTYTCSACDDTYVADEVAATGHKYNTVVTAPTCTEAGYTTYTCSACNDTYVDDEVEATGHKYNTVVTAPTCEEKGYTTYTCSACSDTYVADEVEATGHNYSSEVTKAPTCEEKGVKTYTCACSATYTEEIAANGHSLTQVEAKAPTCEEAGYKAYEYCSECVYTTFEAVEATGHSYNAEVTKAPTCEEKGVKTYSCACGATYTEEIAANGHTLTQVDAKAPTCEEAGYKAYEYCSECVYTTFEAVEATGHKYEAVVTAPTCTDKGYTTYTCSCNDTYVADEVEATGHSFTNYVSNNNATCTANGTETAKCDNCDETHTREVADSKLDHTYEAVVTAPTCVSAGYTTYTCACGHTYRGNEVAATGQHAGGTAYCNVLAVCSTCGASYGSYNASNHSSSETKSVYVNDTTHYVRTVCCNDVVRGEGHSWSNGTCTACGGTHQNHSWQYYIASNGGACTTCGYSDPTLINWESVKNATHTQTSGSFTITGGVDNDIYYFSRIASSNNCKHPTIELYSASKQYKKFMLIRYRGASGMNFGGNYDFTLTIDGASYTGGGANNKNWFNLVYDNQWHYIIVELPNIPTYELKMRIADGTMSSAHYFDIEYIKFFDSYADAKAFEVATHPQGNIYPTMNENGGIGTVPATITTTQIWYSTYNSGVFGLGAAATGASFDSSTKTVTVSYSTMINNGNNGIMFTFTAGTGYTLDDMAVQIGNNPIQSVRWAGQPWVYTNIANTLKAGDVTTVRLLAKSTTVSGEYVLIDTYTLKIVA